MIRAVYACRWQRQITWDACSVFNVAHNQTAYSNSNFVARNVHNHFSNQQMKRVQLGNSDLQVSVACIGTMVSSSARPECNVSKFARTALLITVNPLHRHMWASLLLIDDGHVLQARAVLPAGSMTGQT